MKISIETKELVYGIRKISEAELATLREDEKERYKLATGSEKDDLLYRSIETAKAHVDTYAARFLVLGYPVSDLVIAAPVDGEFIPSYIVWEYRDCRRRLGKENAILTHSHDALVEGALAHFYEKVGASDLAGEHRAKREEAMSLLLTTLFMKNAPLI